jgi:hypothetical protein
MPTTRTHRRAHTGIHFKNRVHNKLISDCSAAETEKNSHAPSLKIAEHFKLGREMKSEREMKSDRESKTGFDA